jgi:hypothetical protein
VNRRASQRSWLTFHRPPWQERLPPRLRLAAETQLGTWILAALIMLLRGEVVGAVVLLMPSFLFFTLLTGWREDRRITSPPLWWACVAVATALGALALIGSIFGDAS